jgi:hypothetical protein
LRLDAFLERYPGLFLLAIGHLKAEPSERTRSSLTSTTQEYKTLDTSLDATLRMGFGEHPSPAINSHPLAGCSFFVPRADLPYTLKIGRAMECDLTVPDISVSDIHCIVTLDEQGVLTIADQGSTNGTFINLRPITPEEPRAIEDEEIITVGRYCFQLLEARTLFEALHVLNLAM